MNPNTVLFTILLTTIFRTNHRFVQLEPPPTSTSSAQEMLADNETIYEASNQIRRNCMEESIQFLYGHNLVRARKMEQPLAWDSQLANYASWWADQRQGDCELVLSFPEGHFQLGENLYWGSGSTWTPMDAVRAWADEEKYCSYWSNSCTEGQMCGHYSQIVWKTTRRIGCARAVCDSGDVFMTCNYHLPGNYVGERPN